jgi:hypothetical protein
MTIPKRWLWAILALLDLPAGHPARRRAEPLVESHKKSHRKRLGKSLERRKEAASDHQAETGATRAVRRAVFARAAGRCEAGGCPGEPTAMDHFFGRARSELVETCWALCAEHDFQKTNNLPGRRFWLLRFRRHAEKHGYGKAMQMADQQLALDAAQHPKPLETT